MKLQIHGVEPFNALGFPVTEDARGTKTIEIPDNLWGLGIMIDLLGINPNYAVAVGFEFNGLHFAQLGDW